MQVWVADVGDRVAGFASAGPARGDATIGELHTIYLDPVRAGQGIGHVLLVAAEVGIRESGFARAVLWVLRDNTVARRFYERHGWAADGAQLMDPHLGPSPVVEVRYARALGDA